MQKAVGRMQHAESIRCLLPSPFGLLPTVLDYPTTANNFITAIKHGRLAGRDGALRRIELHLDAIVWQRSNSCRLGCVPIPHAHFGAHQFGWGIESDPVYPRRR